MDITTKSPAYPENYKFHRVSSHTTLDQRPEADTYSFHKISQHKVSPLSPVTCECSDYLTIYTKNKYQGKKTVVSITLGRA